VTHADYCVWTLDAFGDNGCGCCDECPECDCSMDWEEVQQ
jgi:hypothetical protein